jgi:hypothetical protein
MGGSDDRGRSLEHFGIKGMHWGVRKRLNPDASDDARAASETKRKVSPIVGPKALSNQELKTLISRMKLEQEYSRLKSSKSTIRIEKGQKFIKNAQLAGKAVKTTVKFAKSPAGQAILRTFLPG